MLYEFTELQLDKEEFDNLVFMNAPPWWEEHYFPNYPFEEEQKFLLSLCCQPLKEVVIKVMERAGIEKNSLTPTVVKVGESSGQQLNSTTIFEKLLDISARDKGGSSELEPWFKSHENLSRCFNKDLMPPIWIRNLSDHEYGERKKCPNGTFYIEDGNTRALIYALKVALEKVEYTPFPAIHATSWGIAAEILDHLPQKASELENNGVLPYKKHFKNGVRLPIGIRVDTYERC